MTQINFDDYLWWNKVHAFHRIDNEKALVTGKGIYKTVDQGLTWNLTNADTNHFYNSIYMQDSLRWFAVGNNGVLLKTTNGGINWSKSFISSLNLKDILFINDAIGFCVGGGNNQLHTRDGIILSTFDGGISWSEYTTMGRSLNSIQCVDSVCYIVGGDQVFKLSNFDALNIKRITPSISSLKVWPNPTSNFVGFDFIGGSTSWELKIFDSVGKLVHSDNRKTNNRLSFKNYPNGLYFIQLSSGRDIHLGMVVKE